MNFNTSACFCIRTDKYANILLKNCIYIWCTCEALWFWWLKLAAKPLFMPAAFKTKHSTLGSFSISGAFMHNSEDALKSLFTVLLTVKGFLTFVLSLCMFSWLSDFCFVWATVLFYNLVLRSCLWQWCNSLGFHIIWKIDAGLSWVWFAFVYCLLWSYSSFSKVAVSALFPGTSLVSV